MQVRGGGQRRLPRGYYANEHLAAAHLHIRQLGIHNLRLFEQAQLVCEAGLTTIYGANGSGKTSLLEALSLLSYGRSFVSSNTRDLIRFGSDQLVVHLEFDNQGSHQAGFSLNRQLNKVIRLDGQNQKQLREVASLLPVLIVSPRSFQLLDGSSKERRRLIDWLAFHVKPGFASLVTRVRRLLLQRNSLLKSNAPQSQLDEWTEAFALASEELVEQRSQVLAQLHPHFIDLVGDWLSDKKPELGEHKGWSRGSPLLEQLHKDLETDKRNGHTSKGAHRYDLRFSASGHKAAQVLSRGEKKRLVLALVFAQLQLVKQLGVSPLLCIDDLDAELDKQGRQQALAKARVMCDQVLVTAIDQQEPNEHDTAVFHVEQGKIHKR